MDILNSLIYSSIQLFFEGPAWVIGIYTAVVLGSLFTLFWYGLLSIFVKLPPTTTNIEWWIVGPLTGAVERLFFSCIIGFKLSGTAISMIAWLGIKGQTHYNIFTNAGKLKPGELKKRYRAILSNLGSFLFAALGGYVWREKIDVWPMHVSSKIEVLSWEKMFAFLIIYLSIYIIIYKLITRKAIVEESIVEE